MIKNALLLTLTISLAGCANDPAMTSAAMMALGSNTGSNARSTTDAGTAALVAALAGNGVGQKRYDCAEITPEQAQLLLDQGHTYLDPEKDNIACGKLSASTTTSDDPTTAALAAAAAMGIDVPGFNLPRTQASSAKYAKQTAQQYQYRCADLTASQADQLYAAGHTYLDADGDGDACEPDARRDYTPRATTSSSGGNCHWVDGYTRKNGSYVKGHRRCK